MPVTDDAARLYATWVGMGGEGIVLKDPGSPYRPGERSAAWLKLKPKLTIEAAVTGGSAEGIAWFGGEAVMLELAHVHPTADRSRAGQAPRRSGAWTITGRPFSRAAPAFARTLGAPVEAASPARSAT